MHGFEGGAEAATALAVKRGASQTDNVPSSRLQQRRARAEHGNVAHSSAQGSGYHKEETEADPHKY